MIKKTTRKTNAQAKAIKGCPGYFILRNGTVWGVHLGKVLAEHKGCVKICDKDGKQRHLGVKKLVKKYFK